MRSRVLRASSLFERFQNGWRPFQGALLLGDSGYGLKDWLMPPLHNFPDTQVEQDYNRAHKSTRRIIECTYGILKARFPCLNYLRVNPEFAGLIVLACATLHNIANKEDFLYEIRTDETDTSELRPENDTEDGRARQNEILHYFA